MAKEKAQAYLVQQKVFSNEETARQLYDKSSFGTLSEDKEKIVYNLSEALYLVDTEKLEVLDLRGNRIERENLLNKIRKIDKKIQIKYPVYKDLRDRGYIVKTALKFGADFRVYPKGKKPREAHAKWIVFTDSSTSKFSWTDFSAKNRVAHSTKKNLLLAIVDEEGDVLYYEVEWVKP